MDCSSNINDCQTEFRERMAGIDAAKERNERERLVGDPREKPTAKAAETRRTFRRISSAELATGDYRVKYLVDGILAERQPCIIAGNEKTLKTTIAIDLAISIATATPFLGTFAVNEATRVGIMSGESGLGTLQETAARICAAKGIDLASIGVVWSDELPDFDDLRDMDGVAEFVKRDELGVLIIDPAYLCMDPDGREGSIFKMGAMLGRIAKVCLDAGATPAVVHHNKATAPGREFHPAELQDIAWAGFKQFARQWILLARQERYEPGTGNHKLWLTAGGSNGHGTLKALDIREGIYPHRRWDLTVTDSTEARAATTEAEQSANEQKQSKTVDRHADKLLDVLKAMPTPVFKAALKDRAKGSGGTFAKAWARLEDRNQVFEWPTAKNALNGQWYPTYWHEAPPAETESTASTPGRKRRRKRAH